jgi:hypothetical protein
MSSNLPTSPNDGDGFSRSLNSDRLTKGQIAKWDAEKRWHDRDGLLLPTQMFVMGVDTALQRWKDQRPENILDKPLPDPQELNAAIPIKEWELDMTGRPRPPWEKVYAIYLVNLTTGTLYSYVSGTVGARICYEQLQESVYVMRALRGAKVLPLVNLEQRQMKTEFGMKSRPHYGSCSGCAEACSCSFGSPDRTGRSCHPQRDASGQARHHGGVHRRRNAAVGLSPVKTHTNT